MGDWKEKALETQQELYERLGDRRWDRIQTGERWALESKVGFAMFGEPSEDNTNTRNYTKEEYEVITKVCDKIYEVRGRPEILIAFLYLICKGSENMFKVNVFRILNRNDRSVFIDIFGFVYESWSDFMDNNKLPECKFSYPKNGIYEADKDDNVLVSFAEAPARSGSTRRSTLADVTLEVASMVIPLLDFIFYRGHNAQLDQGKEEILPIDINARNLWLSVAGRAFGVESGEALKGMIGLAASGNDLSNAGLIAVDMLNYGSLTVNGLGIANGLVNLIERRNRRKLTTLDLIQFTTSVLFFTNAAMNAKTAIKIIQQVQDETLSNLREELNKRRGRALDILVRKTRGGGMNGESAWIIKDVKNVGSKEEFFKIIIRAQK